MTGRTGTDRPTGRRSIFRQLSYVIGAVVAASGLTVMPAALTSAIYQEWADFRALVLAGVITMVVGGIFWRYVGRRGSELTSREGFAIVGVSWFVISAFGALPYIISGAIPSYTDAFFETASGFTTTGSSILADPGALGHGLLMWRSLTQWVGGMGIIVLSIAILPLLGVGGVQLARAESPGPTPDRLTPRFSQTAKRLWLLYAAITMTQILMLTFGDMNLFQAIAHSFTTMSTGGFGTEASSMNNFTPYTQWVVIVFMLIAGSSFALLYRGLRRPKAFIESAEFRLYAVIAIAAIIIVVGGLIATGNGWSESTIRDGAFTSVSIITTTGFGTADFALWVSGLQVFIVGLMFLGGMAGSTAGGVKTFRIGTLAKAAHADLRRLIHPRGVFVTRFGKKAVPEDIVESIQSFFLFYMFLFMTGTFLLAFINSNSATDLDLVTTATAVASALGNIGPGLADVGPTSNYAGIPGAGKWLLSFLMITGRLEVFPVLLLFTPDLWRK